MQTAGWALLIDAYRDGHNACPVAVGQVHAFSIDSLRTTYNSYGDIARAAAAPLLEREIFTILPSEPRTLVISKYGPATAVSMHSGFTVPRSRGGNYYGATLFLSQDATVSGEAAYNLLKEATRYIAAHLEKDGGLKYNARQLAAGFKPDTSLVKAVDDSFAVAVPSRDELSGKVSVKAYPAMFDNSKAIGEFIDQRLKNLDGGHVVLTDDEKIIARRVSSGDRRYNYSPRQDQPATSATPGTSTVVSEFNAARQSLLNAAVSAAREDEAFAKRLFGELQTVLKR